MGLDALLRTVSGFLAAMLLGGLVGIEREQRRKPAGCRTYMLVCGASAVFVDLGNHVVEGFSAPGDVKPDPTRILQAIIVGLGFIGGGIMGKGEDQHHNIATAASLLLAAAIGAYCGLHLFWIATALTAFTIFILHGIRKLEERIEQR